MLTTRLWFMILVIVCGCAMIAACNLDDPADDPPEEATLSAPDAVTSEEFCNDPRPLEMLETLRNVVRQRDGEQFARLISPNGLYMSLYPWSEVIHLTADEVRGFFDDDTLRDWGYNSYGSREETNLASLAGNVTALLEADFLPDTAIITCNDNQDGLSDRVTLYSITMLDNPIHNFYAVMRPGSPGNELAWGAWGLGFAYWDGEPTLLALTHYVWTP
jgi:hypothetical protein